AGGYPSAVPTVPADSGYTFTGWSSDGGITKLSAEALAARAVTGNITYTAYYTQNNSGTIITPPVTPVENYGIKILINGKAEIAGKAKTAKVNGQMVTTVTVDQSKLEEKLSAEGEHPVILIPMTMNSDVAIVEFNGQMVKSMEHKGAIVEIQTENGIYKLPALQINMDAISKQLDIQAALQDIRIQIEIGMPTAEMIRIFENAAADNTFTIVTPPINFTVRGIYGDTIIELSEFNTYIERMIAIPVGIDPNQITTGVVVDPDGSIRHVPTKIVYAEGKYYAQVNSLTNSIYAVISNPVAFTDVANHWAKEAVNDMGSRMVISGIGDLKFNPDQDITRAEFAAIIVRGLGLKPISGSAPFSDVRETDWYSSVINTAYAYNLINGFEDGSFRPLDKITREQAMAIIAKAMTITGLKAKLEEVEAGRPINSFTDSGMVSAWAKEGIADSLQAGIITGRNGSELAPKANITRAEVAVIVKRLLQKSDLIE
ncbi:S-layer homology domain-containing protein, partial [Paenibacillus agaridevorans]|uniref:S-layer homology domain-containing protein n=1 Tax=Paenibacillus agaridevorans TaxID=171404 RepID=UPI0015E82B68